MLKLIHSKTIVTNISIFQNEKGEYWGVEQNLHDGRYLVSQYDEKDLKDFGKIRPDTLSMECPTVGENPTVHALIRGTDEIDKLPEEVVKEIFAGR